MSYYKRLFSTHRNKKEKDFINPPKLFIGIPNSGMAIHPWDGLKKCPNCGSYPWIVGKDGKDFHSGFPFKILCLKCKKVTSSGSISDVKREWNDTCNK